MARRPIHKKKLRRLRKALDRRPLTAYVDIVEWLKLHGHADTTGQAEKLMTDGKVKVDSHAVGRERVAIAPPLSPFQKLKGDKPAEPVLQWVPRRRVRAEFSEQLRVDT